MQSREAQRVLFTPLSCAQHRTAVSWDLPGSKMGAKASPKMQSCAACAKHCEQRLTKDSTLFLIANFPAELHYLKYF